MKRFGNFLIAALAATALILSVADAPAMAMGKGPDAPRLTAEELRSQIDSPDVVVLDVRVGNEWTQSKEKIQGAVREEPEKFKEWATKYPKEKTLVFY